MYAVDVCEKGCDMVLVNGCDSVICFPEPEEDYVGSRDAFAPGIVAVKRITEEPHYKASANSVIRSIRHVFESPDFFSFVFCSKTFR